MNITTQTPATQTTQQTAPTPFDPTICFTCFGDYVEALLGIEQAEGPEVAFSAFKILADFCLYGIEPDPAANPWGWAWPMVERKAKNSNNNRRRGFGAEDSEKATAIKEYLAEHPEDSMRAVARAVGCSDRTVRKVVASIRSLENGSSAVSDSHSSPESRAASDGNSCLVRTHMRTRNSSRTHDSDAVPLNSVCHPTDGIHLLPTSTQPGTQADGEGTAV